MKFHGKALYTVVGVGLQNTTMINGLYLMWHSRKRSCSLHGVLRNSAGVRNLAQRAVC